MKVRIHYPTDLNLVTDIEAKAVRASKMVNTQSTLAISLPSLISLALHFGYDCIVLSRADQSSRRRTFLLVTRQV